MRKLLFLLTLALLPACNPCAERCRVEANNIDECLHDWGLEWADLDADDATTYKAACVSAEEVFDAGLEARGRTLEQKLCRETVADLRLANDCDAVWDALISYGGE